MIKKGILVWLLALYPTLLLWGQKNKTLEQIEKIFQKLDIQGVDMSKPFVYGYFFYDTNKENLEKLKSALISKGYAFLNLNKTEYEDYILTVNKKEAHNAVSLFERGNELQQLAEANGVRSFDGWDVGTGDEKKPMTSRLQFDEYVKNIPADQLYTRANALYDIEMYEEAVKVFDRCIELSIKSDTCYYKRGNAKIAEGFSSEGITDLQDAASLNPQYFEAFFNIGALLYANNQYVKAIAFYKKAKELRPNLDGPYYGLATCLYQLGSTAEAKQVCEKAIELNASNQEAQDLLYLINNPPKTVKKEPSREMDVNPNQKSKTPTKKGQSSNK